MKWIFIILLIVFSSQSFGQKLEWVKSIEGVGPNNINNSIFKNDNQGNFLIYGGINGIADTDPSNQQMIVGKKDSSFIFLTKWDKNGKHLWTIYGNNFFNNIDDLLAIDKTNNIVFSKYCEGPFSFQFKNKQLINKDSLKSSIIMKVDQEGNLIWNYIFKFPSHLLISNIVTNSKNEIIVNGFFSDSVKFTFLNDKGEETFYAKSKFDDFILKFDSTGQPIWFYQIDGTNEVYPALDVDIFDNIYYSSRFENEIGLNPKDSQNKIKSKYSIYGQFILKLDTKGNFIYGKPIQFGRNSQPFIGLKPDSFSNIYILFSFDSIIDVDPSNQEVIKINKTEKNSNAVLIKWDSAGNYKWSRQFEKTIYARSLWIDNQIIVALPYWDSIMFDSQEKHKFKTNKDEHGLGIAIYNLEGEIINSFQLIFQKKIFIDKFPIYRDNFKNLFLGVYNSYKIDFDPSIGVKLYGDDDPNTNEFSIAKYSSEILNSDSLDRGMISTSQISQALLNNLSISFQNPITDFLELKLDKTKVYELTIYDINGRKLLEKIVNKKATAEMDLREFASGIYILNCQSDDRCQSYKIEKE